MKLIVLGAPGSGKGTQAQEITKHYRIPHISTGSIFRENIKNKTELGNKVSNILSSGGLVSDDLTNSIVKDRLLKEDCLDGFLLDGYPRNIIQAEALDSFGISLDVVIYLKVEDKYIVERMAGRLTCPNCSAAYHKIYNPPKIDNVCDICSNFLIQREDDKKEIVLKRLNVFYKELIPMLDFYKNKSLLVEINGVGEPRYITETIIKQLEKR